MKKYLSIGLLVCLVVTLMNCSKMGNGELRGISGREKWIEPAPYGMNFIEKGSFTIGANDQDITSSTTPPKTVSVDAFWIDDTEITNNEYRQFIYWVRDSIARTLLADQYPEFMISEDRRGNPVEPPRLNWKEKIDWKNPDYTEALAPIYIPDNERFMGKKEIDARKLYYEYQWIDLKQAARRVNSFDYSTQSYTGNTVDVKGEKVPVLNRSSFIMKEQTQVYPDTLCWIRDFTFSYNEPYATRYFWHPAYDNYPLVGITWKQAKAFCRWRTQFYNDYALGRHEASVNEFRLPTEVEWEFAARGNKKLSMYPWGGYYTSDQQGKFKANFKPLRGDYLQDKGLIAVEVGSYDPNENDLYDMAGNVAEWTISAYDESSYTYVNDLNPDFEYNAKEDDAPAMKRKVIRGGSWKDVSSFLQVGARSYEYQDTAKSYIGFRCVRTALCTKFYTTTSRQ